jgi:hypothetical protein
MPQYNISIDGLAPISIEADAPPSPEDVDYIVKHNSSISPRYAVGVNGKPLLAHLRPWKHSNVRLAKHGMI